MWPCLPPSMYHNASPMHPPCSQRCGRRRVCCHHGEWGRDGLRRHSLWWLHIQGAVRSLGTRPPPINPPPTSLILTPLFPSLQVGLFSLGIIPYINASIVLQLMTAAFPGLKKMQREEGAQVRGEQSLPGTVPAWGDGEPHCHAFTPQGRARFQYYQKLAAFVFAIVQAVGQLLYIR